MIASKIFTHVSPLNIMIMNEKIVDSSAPFEFYKQIMPEQGIKNLDNSKTSTQGGKQ